MENKKMAKVTAQVLGGAPKILEDVYTVQEALEALELEGNYVANVNGDTVDMDYELSDGEFLNFATAVKGGM